VPKPTRGASRAKIASWELALVRAVAGRFRTAEREELEAELARRLLALKLHPPRGIRDWRRYATKFLHNKASNWIRDSRARERRAVALDKAAAEPETFALTDHLPAPEPRHDLRIAFAHIWKELDPELRAFWQLLLEENGNQLRVARKLGKHRNTVRLWIKKIRRILVNHGFR